MEQQSAPDLSTLEHIEAELAGVDAALQRLDDGTYGSCTACGTAIDDDTLAADPTATLCATCNPPEPRDVSSRSATDSVPELGAAAEAVGPRDVSGP